jgi:hypothetical protein
MADAPILVTALFAPGDDGWLQALRRAHYPPASNRVPAHLTLFRLLPPSAEGELGRRLATHAAGPPPRAAIGGIMTWGRGRRFASTAMNWRISAPIWLWRCTAC